MSISRFSVIKSTCWILLVSGNGLNYCFHKHGGGGHTQNSVCFIENFFSRKVYFSLFANTRIVMNCSQFNYITDIFY